MISKRFTQEQIGEGEQQRAQERHLRRLANQLRDHPLAFTAGKRADPHAPNRHEQNTSNNNQQRNDAVRRQALRKQRRANDRGHQDVDLGQHRTDREIAQLEHVDQRHRRKDLGGRTAGCEQQVVGTHLGPCTAKVGKT